MHPGRLPGRSGGMIKSAALLSVLLLAACANPTAPTAAPSGIRAQSGGGEQQLGQVRGANVGVGGALSTTRVQ